LNIIKIPIFSIKPPEPQIKQKNPRSRKKTAVATLVRKQLVVIQCCQVHKEKICQIVFQNMPNRTKICQIFFATKNTWKIGNRFFSSFYEVYCTIDDSYKHSLRLSIENNLFPAKHQTLRCYRLNILPTTVASSALRKKCNIKDNYIKPRNSKASN